MRNPANGSLTIVSATLGIALALSFAGCDNNNKPRPLPKADILRNGEVLHTVSLRYFDGRPSVSANGTRLAFVSGREITTAGAGALKAFKIDPSDTAAAPARVTSTDLGAETDVFVSPDGATLAILATDDGTTSLLLTDWSATITPVAVTLANGETPIAPITFNAAGSALAFSTVSISSGTITRAQYVGSINATTLAVTLTAIPACANACDAVVGWLGTSATVTLSDRDTTTGTLSLYQTDATTITAPTTPALWASGIRAMNNVPPATSTAGAWLAVRSYPSGSSKNHRGMPVRSLPMSLSSTLGSSPASTGSLGYDVSAIAANTAGTAALWVERDTWECSRADVSGVPLALSNGSTVSRLYPLSEATAGSYTFITDPCELERADGTAGTLDGKVTSIAVSGSSTATAMSFAYVTIAGGDAEVQWGTFNGTTGTSRSVSSNTP